ncbi:hypothetical protein ASPWEDRAFT_170133 [Aspergillus wentii DTO 134E9]|uniref:TeaA receptor TeaR n=1 Tax=Aspergillus wentii DTO 134E9 TaxID=1073089 RepID=A0A1L9RNV1_ASPWE|nr:uncharacterized protein ASPWEDRAFT_170133 [Aspergillus wentii DTO 134E9]KAI9934240.1 hypothetical protein MW887_005314 [Aspergillus wentii]OJJ36620.1 hypothetical protein ASPWEDRAFT_170133 [Aspergillus wentii DTO 134E9]
MAGATTAAYSADILTSPGSVDGHHDWEYSVPIRHDSINRRSKSRSSHDSARKSRDRNSKGSRSSSMSRQVYMQDSGYLTSARGRRETSRNRKGSETSSLRDIYGQETASRSAGNLRESGESLHHSGKGAGDAHWIHRDKLARIESEELHQIQAAFMSRRMDSKRGRNHDLYHSGVSGSPVTTPPMTEQTEPWPDLHEEQRGYIDSPGTYDADGIYESDSERKKWDLRRPEETATNDLDDGASGIYQNPALRKSSSRIPISTGSPAPTNGRDYRSMSGSKSRRASEAAAADSTDTSTQSGGSRPGSRGVTSTATKKTPAKGTANRKASASTTRKVTPKPRTTSGTNGQRPTTRSGEIRPTTAVNRPEGDPPWLATMYKPDPRLPPDQQMLPTHARKMQQEMWAKEGKTPTTYDREFAPLAISPDDAPPTDEKTQKPEESPKPEEENNEKVEKEEPQPPPQEPEASTWPLTSPKSSETGTRPSTGTGYSPMPKLQEPPSAGLTPKWSPPVVTAQEPPKKEKGCGCCIVM